MQMTVKNASPKNYRDECSLLSKTCTRSSDAPQHSPQRVSVHCAELQRSLPHPHHQRHNLPVRIQNEGATRMLHSQSREASPRTRLLNHHPQYQSSGSESRMQQPLVAVSFMKTTLIGALQPTQPHRINASGDSLQQVKGPSLRHQLSRTARLSLEGDNNQAHDELEALVSPTTARSLIQRYEIFPVAIMLPIFTITTTMLVDMAKRPTARGVISIVEALQVQTAPMTHNPVRCMRTTNIEADTAAAATTIGATIRAAISRRIVL